GVPLDEFGFSVRRIALTREGRPLLRLHRSSRLRHGGAAAECGWRLRCWQMADGGWQKPKFDVRGRIQNLHFELRTLNLGLRFAISAAAIPAQPRSAQPPSAQLLPG